MIHTGSHIRYRSIPHRHSDRLRIDCLLSILHPGKLGLYIHHSHHDIEILVDQTAEHRKRNPRLGHTRFDTQPSAHRTELVSTSPSPNDADRANAYGPLAAGGERMLGMFQSAFDQNADINDAGNVAAAIQALIEMENPRPVRTVVGEDMGVDAINAAIAPFQTMMTCCNSR